jgi:hypothetical protein
MIVSDVHRMAVLDNAALCAAMWRAHGLGVESFLGCVGCRGAPPRFYPDVVTVDPAADPADQMRAIAERAARAPRAFSVKDSFRSLELGRLGFAPLFEARWIRRPAGPAAGAKRLDWRPVADALELSAWEDAWSGGAAEPPVFRPAFMTEPGVAILAGWAGGAVAAGCVVTTTGAAAGLSNVFGDPIEAVSAAAAAFPGRDLVGYERGEDLEAALGAGFAPVGELVVWSRSVTPGPTPRA